MIKCLYCKRELVKEYLSNKIGCFCNEDHLDKYLKSLSR